MNKQSFTAILTAHLPQRSLRLFSDLGSWQAARKEKAMQVVRVQHERDAPKDADTVTIDNLPSGGFQFSACVADAPQGASFNSGSYPNVDSAVKAGLDWAQSQNCTKIFVIDRTTSSLKAR